MFWKIKFISHPDHASHLGDSLEEHVAAVSFFETKIPNEWVVEAITISAPDDQAIQALLTPVCTSLGIGIPALSVEELPDTDWLEATWRSFPPHQVGRFYIYGSHTTPTPPEDSIPLEINAATAFGSGEHETTAGCLLTLDDLATQGRIFHKPLDMGCGSGILAIAIAKTWTVPVIAADNDPESVKVTLGNADLNKCDGLITAFTSEGFENPDVSSKGPYDLVVANILAAPLIGMADSMAKFLAPKGLVILSGLLNWQMKDVVEAYAQVGIRLVEHRTQNDWEALLMVKEG